MKKFFGLILVGFLLGLIGLSCMRTGPSDQPGELKRITLSDLKGIPLEYGSLVSVTIQGGKPGWARLWFEDADKTIRIVRMTVADDRISSEVTVIPRYLNTLNEEGEND